MRARHAFFLTPGPPNLRAIGAMARRRQSKHGEGRVRGRGYSRRGHGPGERESAHLSRWCVSAPQAAGEGARRARAPGGAQPGRSLGAAWGEAQKAHRGLSRQFLQRPQSLARQAVHVPQRCDFGLVRDLESAAASSRAFASAARWNSWGKVICGLVGAGTG